MLLSVVSHRQERWEQQRVPGSERVCRCLGGIQTSLPTLLQTIYNAITNGTPCVIVEGSGRVADVIAQVANLPVAKITIALIQRKLSVLFQDTYELFTESKLVEWTKKVSALQAPLSFGRPKGSQGCWPVSCKGLSGKFEPRLPQPSSSLSWWAPQGLGLFFSTACSLQAEREYL